ncbi:MAG: hypothetical protein AAFP68_22635, partial [Pseudomonadota bacterium]
MTKRVWTVSLLLAGAAVGVSSGLPTYASDPRHQIRPVEHMASDIAPAREIPGTAAMLRTFETGATMTLSTAELIPGHVTTAWWVIINKPMLCEAKPCSAQDVIGRSKIVETQIVYADGVINDSNGKAQFAAYLPQGPVKNGWY